MTKRLLILVCCLILVHLPVQAAIAFDGSSNGATVTSNTTLSWTHTITSATNGIAIVGVTARGGGTLSGCTFGGTTMTAGPTVTDGISFHTGIFYLTSTGGLAAGASQTVSCTFSGFLNLGVGCSVSYTGAKQTAIFDANTTLDANAEGASPRAVSVTIVTANAWLVEWAYGDGGAGEAVASTGMTGRCTNTHATSPTSQNIIGDSNAALGAGAQSMSVSNLADFAAHEYISVAIAPAAAATAATAMPVVF